MVKVKPWKVALNEKLLKVPQKLKKQYPDVQLQLPVVTVLTEASKLKLPLNPAQGLVPKLV